MKYEDWLINNYRKNNGEKVSERTVNKYTQGLKTISFEMIRDGVIAKPLINMNHKEFIIAMETIFNDKSFIIKDTTGHKMYSNALKKYEKYLSFLNENQNNSI